MVGCGMVGWGGVDWGWCMFRNFSNRFSSLPCLSTPRMGVLTSLTHPAFRVQERVSNKIRAFGFYPLQVPSLPLPPLVVAPGPYMVSLFDAIFPLVAQRLKRLSAMRETWVWSLGQEDSLEKEMAIHSSILAWRIPWTEEPVGYSPWGRRVGND